jgi:hypothetical protein
MFQAATGSSEQKAAEKVFSEESKFTGIESCELVQMERCLAGSPSGIAHYMGREDSRPENFGHSCVSPHSK